MSGPRPSGLKPPATSKLAKPGSGLPQPKSGLMQPGTLAKAQSALAKSARAAGLNASVAEKYAADALQALEGEEELAPPAPNDDFIIGDRVYVNGSKPGYIAFLGETQFAAGEWAGVVLDDSIGKNDGSISGVRYFQCEPKRGMFCKITKLTRTPGVPVHPNMPSSRGDDTSSEVSMPVNGNNENTPARRPTTPSRLQRPTTPSIPRPTTPSIPRPINKSLSSSNTSLNKGVPPTKVKSEPQATSTPAPSGVKHSFKLGDRVLVSGSKPGTLRYIGPADFAKGEWAGVELDDPLGKNDGAVAGKRYFDCRPRYGLFAPVHKVTKMSANTTPSLMTRSLGSAGLKLSRDRSGSQESVSSLSSATSSASRPRVRLGVTALNSNQQAKSQQRPGSLNISATTSALQKALKEKEEHIEQLLRERDLERSEVARAAAQVDEAQEQLAQLKAERDRYQEGAEDNLGQLRARIKKLESKNHELEMKLEDEKRKNEDLQFQIEEEVISKDDLESRTEEEEAKIRDLEKSLKREKERSEKFETDYLTFKAITERQESQLLSMEETQTSYLDQVEELTHKLSQAEMKVQTYENTRLEEGAKTSQVGLELAEKSARVTELEDFLSLRDKEMKQLQDKLREVNEEMKLRATKLDKLQNTVEELTEKLKASENSGDNLTTQVQNFKSANSDLQRQLEGNQSKLDQLSEEKSQLERQIGEMMKNSGDSSKQLSMLNEQLSQKNRKIEELQADLSTSTQKWHNLNNQHEQVKREKEREIETLKAKNDDNISNVNSKLDDLQRQLEKSTVKMKTMESDFEQEKTSLLNRKEAEINELKQQLETNADNLSKQEIQTQAHKQFLDKITLEKEAIQFERDKVEKQLKRLEAEKESLSTELVQAKVAASKAETSWDQVVQGKKALEEQIQDLKEDKERLANANSEVQKAKDDIIAEKDKLATERDQFQREAMEGRATIQQRVMQVEELQKEVERLKAEVHQQQESISQLSQQSANSGTLQAQLAEHVATEDALRKQVANEQEQIHELTKKLTVREKELQSLKIEVEEAQETVALLEDNVKDVEVERDDLKARLAAVEAIAEEKATLEKRNQKLSTDLETAEQRFRRELETLETLRDSLQLEVDNSADLIRQKDKDIKAKSLKISNLENETSTLTGYKSSNEKLERETAELRDKINKLQSKLSESKTNANVINNMESTDNSLVARLKEENESAQHQVTFLNSVIVDLQHKNEELKQRLEAMESGVVNGADDSMDVLTPTRRSAPRMFCDICDIFDSHETEDCPLQEMSDSPPPSQYHGERNQIRPYCDICEEFHVQCSATAAVLSEKKISERDSEPRDPTAAVKDWVKTVDLLKAEPDNPFGNDPEFYHVQVETAFRDSGYYDGILDKSPFDTKPSLTDLMNKGLTEKEATAIIDEIIAKSTTNNLKKASEEEAIYVPGLDKCFSEGKASDVGSYEENVKKTVKESAQKTSDKNRTQKQEAGKITNLKGSGKREVKTENIHKHAFDSRPKSLEREVGKPADRVENVYKRAIDTRPKSLDRSVDKLSDKVENVNKRITDPRPKSLERVVQDLPVQTVSNTTTNRDDSSPDSEYQSGKESLASDSDEAKTPGSDVESSVDTGEVVATDNITDDVGKDGTDIDRAAENCVVS